MRLDCSFFELQAAFAERVAEIACIDRAEAFRLYTTFYWIARDNDAGRPATSWDFDPNHPEWKHFVCAIEGGMNPAYYVHVRHIAAVEAEPQDSSCFTFDYWPDVRTVRIHFGNSADGLALRPERTQDRESELRSILLNVASTHRNAAFVKGTSWLYHVAAYKSFFPQEFVANLGSAGLLYQFPALWGQFIDRYGSVKPELGAPLSKGPRNCLVYGRSEPVVPARCPY